MIETSARLLRLLTLLQAHREWSGTELADRLTVTERTVRRDVDRLRSLGYPVDARPGLGGGYRLGVGAVMPPLLLDDDEAVAMAVGMRSAALSGLGGAGEAAMRALTKLEQVLPSRLRHRVATLHAAIVPMTGVGPSVQVDVLLAVATAIRAHEQLRADYESHDGTATRRVLEPHRVVQAGRRWYLVAWDVDRSDWRTFRLDRLVPRSPTGPRFEPREAPDADLAAYTSTGITTAVYRYQCRFTFHAPATVVGDHFGPGIAVVTAIDEDSCQVVSGTDSLHEAAFYLTSIGVDFVVHEPVELIDYMAGLGARMSRATYRPVT